MHVIHIYLQGMNALRGNDHEDISYSVKWQATLPEKGTIFLSSDERKDAMSFSFHTTFLGCARM